MKVKKYAIEYEYTTAGTVWVEAINKEQAIEKMFNDDYGNHERVIKQTIKKISISK